jgi:monoamine oxidase
MTQGKSMRKQHITRRDALKLLGAGAAGTLATNLLPNEVTRQKEEDRETDVVIVGAGFAGLIAARNLLRQGKRVVLLEARDRVGGRVKGGQLAGHAVDVGGMWVGPTQTRLLALIKEYGFHTTPQFERGKAISELDGKRTYPDGEGSGLDSVAQAEYDRVIGELNHLSAKVPLDAPWTAPQAEQFDEMTVEQWFESKTKNRDLLAYLQLSTRTVFTADPFQLSFLYFLFYLRSGDNFETLIGYDENSGQASLVKETMHRLAVRLASDVEKTLVLEAPVTEISQDAKGVTVKSAKGDWRADYAIVAVPLPLSVRISYQPPLPPERDILAQHMPMGSVIKCWVAYDKPFWRAHGLNGITWSDAPPTAGFFDISPPEGGPGFLGAFIEAHNALKWTGRPVEERKKLIVDRIVSFFGPEGANPIDYEDQDWPSDRWSRGCYGASMGPGIMTTVGKVIRQPHGRIHWAGTETSTKWMGYIDGAIRSGERAVDEVQERYKQK